MSQNKGEGNKQKKETSVIYIPWNIQKTSDDNKIKIKTTKILLES